MNHFNIATDRGTSDIPVPEWLRIDLRSYLFPCVISMHFTNLYANESVLEHKPTSYFIVESIFVPLMYV